MHGSVLRYLLVNAELDSMGGFVDSVVKSSSPRQAEIDKAQAELRQEYDVREERRRELEFLEKGGNPLDFKFGYAASQSVQSTSFTDKQGDRLVKSQVKDSFHRTAPQHVETSGRLGVSEPNTADNLLLFEGERNSKHPNKRMKTSESQQSNSKNTKEPEDSGIIRPYLRRNRSKINRSSSTELAQSHGGLAMGSVDVKGSVPELSNQKNRHTSSVSCPSPATLKGNIVSDNFGPSNLLGTEDDGSDTIKDTSVKEKVGIAYRKSSADVASGETVSASPVIDSLKALVTGSQETNTAQLNGLEDPRGEKESSEISAARGEQGLDQGSSHVNSVEVDVDTKIDLHRVEKPDSNRIPMQIPLGVEGIMDTTVGEMAITKTEAADPTIMINEQTSGNQSPMNSVNRGTVEMQNEKKCSTETERKQQDDLDALQTDMKVTGGLADTCKTSLYPSKSQAEAATSICSKNELSGPDTTALKQQRMVDTLKEDAILEEARTIQAKRKMIAELSLGAVPVEVRTRSQWDFVLEEMAWLANDFAQERLWKMTTAVQICHRVAFTCQLKLEERVQNRKMKNLASTIANAVLQFWSSVEVPREFEGTSLGTDKDSGKESKCDTGETCSASGVTEYARKFLKFVKSSTPCLQAAAPLTPDDMCESALLETSWNDQLTEESLFYSVPSGAMEVYRRSIESHLVRSEKSGSSMQEEVETSSYDPAEDQGYNVYDEDEEETSAYYQPGALECSKSFKLTNKKRKSSMKHHSARSYDVGADLPYGSYAGDFNPSMGKRSTGNSNAGSGQIKRVRTAPRQRIVSPLAASSGDTSSFQDEQSSLNGWSAVQKGTEVSSANFEKQLPYDIAETSGKPKKKKSSAYDQAWHPELMNHGEQEHWKKQPGNHFNMNGLYGPHKSKKQKTAKQSVENNFGSASPITGLLPSPAASQMSNMSNPNKFIKFFGVRDKGRKIKGLKISSGQQGCDNPWSLFEDQALVVLVHDMGPNWEFISDAMNNTLKIKFIYRKPSDCKERHKSLMDRGGDGADSAEDSGNSQSYPISLPGIPKGSARQLFQRLQGPVEEDTLKSHFEKICSIGKKFHCRKTQNDGRDLKQIVPVHNSQVMALSHVFPNNLNGIVLTPLDLCEASTSGQDLFSLENPGIPMLNQGTSVLPTAEANPSIAGSSGVNNLSTTSGLTSGSTRFIIPRGSLPLDEQHRSQQFNQMLSGRNLQQPSLSPPGAVLGSGHGHRGLPGGNITSVNGNNGSTPLSRPGFQGVSSSAVQSIGGMISPGMGGIPNAGSINSVGSASQGNSTVKPMQHMMRIQAAKGNSKGIPALSSGFSNQTTPSVKAHPGHLSLPQQSHGRGSSLNPHLQNPSHASGTQQQAFAIRQRQMHQRYLQQQKQKQQQLSTSGAMTPHVQSQPQAPPASSSPQNSLQQLASSQSLSMPLLPPSPNTTATAQQNPQKQQLPVHGLGRNLQSGASGPNNQRQRQLQQQSGRQHPHQRQPTQGQQQDKPSKGMGRVNIISRSISVDPSHLNGSTMSPGIQGAEKVEETVQTVPGLLAVSTHPQSSNASRQQPKTVPGDLSLSSEQHQQKQLNSDNGIQGQVSAVVPGNNLSTSNVSVTPAVAQPNHQHLLLHQKQDNQAKQKFPRSVSQNHDLSKKSQAGQSVTNTTETASMGTMKGVPHASTDSVCTKAVGYTAVSSPPEELDLQSSDSSEQKSVTRVSNSITESTGNDDPVTTVAQSSPLVQKQLHSPEQLLQNQKHIPSEQHQPFLKTLDLEAVQEKSSSRPPDTMVE